MLHCINTWCQLEIKYWSDPTCLPQLVLCLTSTVDMPSKTSGVSHRLTSVDQLILIEALSIQCPADVRHWSAVLTGDTVLLVPSSCTRGAAGCVSVCVFNLRCARFCVRCSLKFAQTVVVHLTCVRGGGRL